MSTPKPTRAVLLKHGMGFKKGGSSLRDSSLVLYLTTLPIMIQLQPKLLSCETSKKYPQQIKPRKINK